LPRPSAEASALRQFFVSPAQANAAKMVLFNLHIGIWHAGSGGMTKASIITTVAKAVRLQMMMLEELEALAPSEEDYFSCRRSLEQAMAELKQLVASVPLTQKMALKRLQTEPFVTRWGAN
jgi:hypothetical protein